MLFVFRGLKMTILQIRKGLKNKKIADAMSATGLGYSTIYAIKNGSRTRINLTTENLLTNYLKGV